MCLEAAEDMASQGSPRPLACATTWYSELVYAREESIGCAGEEKANSC